MLVPAAIVLISYIGYDDKDNIITTLSGIFGLGIVLFPCKVSWIPAGTPVGFFQVPMEISHIIHSCCAAIFFTLIAINSIFQFTQSGGTMTTQKIRRNRIFRTCGWGMIIEILLLSLFGIAWLVKGEAFPFLNDGWHRGGRY